MRVDEIDSEDDEYIMFNGKNLEIKGAKRAEKIRQAHLQRNVTEAAEDGGNTLVEEQDNECMVQHQLNISPEELKTRQEHWMNSDLQLNLIEQGA